MRTMIVKLNPLTREELYADISPDLLAFILLEAVTNVVNELPVPVRAMSPEEQLADAMDDTDSQMATSIENLVGILIEHDEKNGVDTNSPLYNIEEFSESVTQKLYAAMESVAASNDVAELSCISEALTAAEMSAGLILGAAHLVFTATHLGDQVLFTLGTQ